MVETVSCLLNSEELTKMYVSTILEVLPRPDQSVYLSGFILNQTKHNYFGHGSGECILCLLVNTKDSLHPDLK